MIDVLMVTYNRPQYTQLSLARLLQTCVEDMRVWIWHNGMHHATLEIVKSFLEHPRVHAFHHSRHNAKLKKPTNWLWANARGELLGKVDDDCLVPLDWAEKLRRAHSDVPELGVISCWHFREEDFVPTVAEKKIKVMGGGHRLLQNCWVGGSGYLMKRECLEARRRLRRGGFTRHCLALASDGWVNGWYYPLLYQEHMDDPRSPYTLLKSDTDLERRSPLSARAFGASSLESWTEALRRDALLVQTASADPKVLMGWRRHIDAIVKRVTQRWALGSWRNGW